ncbi:hypothetical protein [Puerhibacterium sp. TATVAM-FAB25]|uniref:hypothetical protein n=1 Tax=Puerhibacterium sp. TATVAM-FAB25 TaxID=3093699 RepID=UPI00397997E9
MRALTPRAVAVAAAALLLVGLTVQTAAAEPRARAAAPGAAAVDDPPGAPAPDHLPDPSGVVDHRDGSTTLLFDDGATFTSQEPQAPARGDGARTLALAAASFTWSATYDVSVTSRSWSTSRSGDVWVDVRSISSCGGKAQNLALYRLGSAGWARVGTVRAVSCSGGSYVWRAVAKGTYRFQLWDGSSSDAYRGHAASGTVRYP